MGKKKPKRPRPLVKARSSPVDGAAPPTNSPTPAPAQKTPTWHFADRLIDLAHVALEHHVRIGLAVVGAIVILGAIALLTRQPGDCITIAGHDTGPIKVCPEHRKAEVPVPADGLHGDTYTDSQAGYSLTLPDPDGWSVFPAIDLPDPKSGQSAKGFSFPAGVLADIPIGVLTDNAVTAFISRTKINLAPVTMWVHRLPTDGRNVEQFIQLETGPLQMRMTGATMATYAAALQRAGVRPTPVPPGTKEGTVKLSAQVISSDHKAALLLWISPYLGLDADIIGRFIVATNYTFYAVAIRPKPADKTQEKFNADVRTMIESLRVLDLVGKPPSPKEAK